MDNFILGFLTESLCNLSGAIQYLIDFTEEIHEVNEWSGTERNFELENKLNEAKHLINCMEEDLEKIKALNK
ncbi:MAG: hypothetical protein IKT40_03305 [Bacilli bacterium]|nr:hypothetical protein [Bacilli bacterium]